MRTDHLLFGAAYYLEYLPYDRLETDFEMMERAGMNTIRIAESTWSTLEPSDGAFDFTHIDRMLAAAARHHISVIIGTPTYAIPTWLAKKYPDILAVTANGQGLYGHRQNMDITHPGYRMHCERVIRALMERVKDVPHVIGFQLDNETKSYGTAGPRVQRMFVSYLKEKYPDIREFNHEFGLDYWSNRVNDWADFPDVRGTINQSIDAEFRKFQRSLVTDFLAWQADIVREYKRDDQFITQNFDFDWTSHSYGYQPEVDQYEAAKCMTVAGADIYHPSQGELTGAEITVCGNIARSIKNENYLILETQAQGLTAWLPYPNQLLLQAYSHIANGANSVMYWHWHSIHNAIESYWKGVLSHDFAENETYREACRIGAEWKRIGAHLINLKKQNRVALLLDNHSLTGLCEFPLETTGNQSYNAVMRWLADALCRMNIEFDMVSSKERDFSGYDFLIVPALYSASEELLHALDGYVADGGHLIATFRSGFSDEQLKIYHDRQPHILSKCLGIHYDGFTYPKDVRVVLTDSRASSNADTVSCPGDSMSALGSRASANADAVSRSSDSVPVPGSPAHDWMELVTCDTAVPVARYDHPAWGNYAAVTENSYGKGAALYLAAFFGEELLETVLYSFFTKNGCAALLEHTPHFPVIVKRGTNDLGKELYYYFNYSGKEQTVLHAAGAGVELRMDTSVAQEETLVLPAWDCRIVEV